MTRSPPADPFVDTDSIPALLEVSIHHLYNWIEAGCPC